MPLDPKIFANLPENFGVYQFFDENSTLLYVGKAKNLKKRVKSYFEAGVRPKNTLNTRLQNMVARIADIKFIIVNSEHDALILENSLIKQLKPRYNILLRDDKTYPYIFLDLSADFPVPQITRKPLNSRDMRCFGPFPSGARELLASLFDILPLVQKTSCVRAKKACIFHQIQKCPAPCEKKITKIAYQKTVAEMMWLLENKTALMKILKEKMLKCAENMLFEEAQILKNRMEKISAMTKFSHITHARALNLDIFALSNLSNKISLFKLFMRNGKICGSDFTLINLQHEAPMHEIYENFLLNFYKQPSPSPPDEILLDFLPENLQIIQDLIAQNQQKRIQILKPQRGFKANLIKIARENANEIMSQKISQNADQNALLDAIRTEFSLIETPFAIEIFDTSHHGFDFITGALVAYENGDFVRENYRRYHLTGISETEQMTQILKRRIQSFAKNAPPNLWVLDGGKAHVMLAKKLLGEAKISLDVLAISKEKIKTPAQILHARRAKGASFDVIYSDKEIFKLNPRDKKLQFFQRLRDEAHRFAIKFHREQKIKAIRTEFLGYSAAQVQKLLNFYGSFENIMLANEKSPDEIAQILKSRKN